jgi:hypothetical protein
VTRSQGELLRDALAHFEQIQAYAKGDLKEQVVIDAICMRAESQFWSHRRTSARRYPWDAGPYGARCRGGFPRSANGLNLSPKDEKGGRSPAEHRRDAGRAQTCSNSRWSPSLWQPECCR